jgi:hypothetical protein
MSARAIVSIVGAALLLGACSQDYNCSYFCGTETAPRGFDPQNGGDPDSVRAKCEKDRASACTAEEGPTRCHCTAASPDLSPGTNSPSFPRVAAGEG